MMTETLGRGYARIEAVRANRVEPAPAVATDADGSPPVDQLNVVYCTLVLAGMAFFLPFNSFIMAVDYFQDHYPDSSIMFDMTTVYISSACVAVVVNNLLVEVFSYNTRITIGYLLSLSTMLFVAICNIAWDSFSNAVSYNINLVAVGLVAFGCTMQQSSYYGLTSCLPRRYTQAVMTGESAAGILMSFDRILTKKGFRQPRRSTFIYFILSIFVLLVHSVSHQLLMRLPFIQYYLNLLRESGNKRKIQLHLQPTEEAVLMDGDAPDSASFGVLKLQTSPDTRTSESETAFSFANPVYSPTATTGPVTLTIDSPRPSIPHTSYKVEDVVFAQPERKTSWRVIKRSFSARWMVARAIYPYMVSIGLAYFTTLCLYPGIASEIISCKLGDWLPIIVMSVFNLFDFIGKIAAAWPYEWTRSQLLMGSGLRLLIVPMILLCAAPRHSPHIKGDVYPVLFSIILGLTNGIFGSIPMMMAPSRVGREHREIAGNMMTLSYNAGTFSGTFVSYLLLQALGPKATRPCRVYPTVPLPTIPTTIPTTHAMTTALISNITLVVANLH